MNSHAVESLKRAFDSPTGKNPPDDELIELSEIEFDTQDLHEPPIPSGPAALIEMILKDPVRLDQLIRRPEQQIELLPRFMAIALTGFSFFGIAMALVLSAVAVWPHLFPIESVLAGDQPRIIKFDHDARVMLISPWFNGDAYKLIAAYAIGLIAATGICLPSLYFYGLLAGIRMTMMDVVIHAIKSKAVAAVTLVGIFPIYVAMALAIAIFPVPQSSQDFILMVGLALPFVAGLAGTSSLYRSLSMLTDTMCAKHRPRRECFLKRLVLSWAAVYSAVSPVLIFTLWQKLQG